MKAIILALGTLLTLTACEKHDDIDFSKGLSVRVKLIDNLCGDFIYQIQDAEYATLGEKNFEYKGKVYDGVFSSTMICVGINNQPLLPLNAEDSFYTVRIYKDLPNLATSCVTCLAALSKKPSVFYYVMPD